MPCEMSKCVFAFDDVPFPSRSLSIFFFSRSLRTRKSSFTSSPKHLYRCQTKCIHFCLLWVTHCRSKEPKFLDWILWKCHKNRFVHYAIFVKKKTKIPSIESQIVEMYVMLGAYLVLRFAVDAFNWMWILSQSHNHTLESIGAVQFSLFFPFSAHFQMPNMFFKKICLIKFCAHRMYWYFSNIKPK